MASSETLYRGKCSGPAEQNASTGQLFEKGAGSQRGNGKSGLGTAATAKASNALTLETLNVLDFVKCKKHRIDSYTVFTAAPAKGMCFVSDDTPYFIHGRMAVKGHAGGTYPDNYLEFIDTAFGPEQNTIEVCSRTVQVDSIRTAHTVDVNPAFKPSTITDAQVLAGIQHNRFNRYRADPPYNVSTAEKMYGTDLPNFKRMIEAGARVCKVGSLMFLLLGPENYQHVPEGVMRVGLIYISVIPNNETRALNIYYKFADASESHYQSQL